MSLKSLKQLQIVVGICVAGVIATFVMSLMTARKIRREEVVVNPATIPVPAAPAVPATR